jgi:hypothetical protein
MPRTLPRVLDLIQWLRRLDARFVAAVTSGEPATESEARFAAVLGALGLALLAVAVVLLPGHGVVQTALECGGLVLAVPYLHGLFEKVLLAVR